MNGESFVDDEMEPNPELNCNLLKDGIKRIAG